MNFLKIREGIPGRPCWRNQQVDHRGWAHQGQYICTSANEMNFHGLSHMNFQWQVWNCEKLRPSHDFSVYGCWLTLDLRTCHLRTVWRNQSEKWDIIRWTDNWCRRVKIMELFRCSSISGPDSTLSTQEKSLQIGWAEVDEWDWNLEVSTIWVTF